MMKNDFVSRAGEKLQFALKKFDLNLLGLVVADFGSSTGGFVDCWLQNGATLVYSVDTSYGELAWKLRNDPRVIVMERTNAMHVTLPQKVDVISVDTGWTKQEKVIPNALKNLKTDGLIISLIKPHYELGIAKPTANEVEEAIKKVRRDIETAGGLVESMVESPITGKRAENKEFLALIKNISSKHEVD